MRSQNRPTARRKNPPPLSRRIDRRSATTPVHPPSGRTEGPPGPAVAGQAENACAGGAPPRRLDRGAARALWASRRLRGGGARRPGNRARGLAGAPGRPASPRRRARGRPDWFQSQQMLGGVCYVDLFAGDLAGIRERIPYFKELGLTYLHLMPLFPAPQGNSDGGYAVSSYREVNPALGTMAELADAGRASCARDGHQPGARLRLQPHLRRARLGAAARSAGDPDYQDYYLIFPDRTHARRLRAHAARDLPRRSGPAASPGSPTSAAGSGRPSTASSGT